MEGASSPCVFLFTAEVLDKQASSHRCEPFLVGAQGRPKACRECHRTSHGDNILFPHWPSSLQFSNLQATKSEKIQKLRAPPKTVE